MFSWPRMRIAVSADPVKETMSLSPTASSRSRAEPQRMEIAPVGKTAAFTMSSTIRCVNQAVGEAGLTMMGTAESNAGAAFSQKPQAGKLKALMKTAAPSAGTKKCWPANSDWSRHLDGWPRKSSAERLRLAQRTQYWRPYRRSPAAHPRPVRAVPADRRGRARGRPAPRRSAAAPARCPRR